MPCCSSECHCVQRASECHVVHVGAMLFSEQVSATVFSEQVIAMLQMRGGGGGELVFDGCHKMCRMLNDQQCMCWTCSCCECTRTRTCIGKHRHVVESMKLLRARGKVFRQV